MWNTTHEEKVLKETIPKSKSKLKKKNFSKLRDKIRINSKDKTDYAVSSNVKITNSIVNKKKDI